MSNTKPDENMTKTAEEAKAVKKEEKPAAKAPAKKEEKPAATKEKTANSAVTKEPEKKAADTADKKPAVSEKKEQPKAAKEVEENVTAYPFTVALTHPIATYRGPSLSFAGKHFGGTVKVVGESGEFYKVSFVRSELGMTTSYMLRQEVEKCRS